MKEIHLHRIDLNLLVVFEALMLEGSVIGAATKLSKTPSAVSHALARLRDQLGDPLMVKVGGKMQASPFALNLIDEVSPILRSIKRMLELPEPFDPTTSTRVFRIACPVSTKVLSQVMKVVHAEAPDVKIEWLSTPRQVYSAVSEGLIDLAHLGGERHLPDGLEAVELPALKFTSFVRDGHPAISNWGRHAWQHYGHVKVAIDNEVRSPVDAAGSDTAPDRKISMLISEFSSVASLLAGSDLIATLPDMVLAWDLERYGLRPLVPVVPVPRFRARFFWSSRMANDPASRWIREIVVRIYREMHDVAESLVDSQLLTDAS